VTDTVAGVFALPMHTRFRGITTREGTLIRGLAGFGEFSPFWDYGTAESTDWLAAAREAAELGSPAPVRDVVPVNCTIPAVAPAAAEALAGGGHGCSTAKVKVAEPGQSLADDTERVRAVRSALGPAGKLRVDANGAWSVQEAVEAITALSRFGLEYVEQPCATVTELAAVRARVGVPVAADESIRRSADPLRVAEAGAADVVVLKVQPLGGVRRCLRLAADIGLPVVVSSALESSVGLSAGVALAAALPELPYACGLATASMFTADVTAAPLRPENGCIAVRRVEPSTASLHEVAADAAATARWERRLSTCAAHLDGQRQ
jgi:o-succinylbenzoate synthase